MTVIIFFGGININMLGGGKSQDIIEEMSDFRMQNL